MMWQMTYTMPTFILLVIITVVFLTHRRLPVRANTGFISLLAIALCTMAADYASTYMDMHAAGFPGFVLWLFNTLFFLLFVMRSYWFFHFGGQLLADKDPQEMKKARRWMLVFLLEEAFVSAGCITGWIFSIQDGYVRGPLYPFINLQFLFWIFCGLWKTIRDRKAEIDRNGMIAGYIILAAGVCLRALLPHVVIMNLFCLFAILIIYLTYMNPDQYMDDVTHLFNEKGWNRVMEEADTRRHFSMAGFGIRGYSTLRQLRGNRKKNEMLRQIGSWITRTWPDLDAFYLSSGIYVIASVHGMDRQKVLDEISRRFEKPWVSGNNEYYLFVNRMVMDEDLKSADNDMMRGTMWDAYHQLNSSEALPLIHIDNALQDRHIRRVHIQQTLNEALNRRGLLMYLQPIMKAGSEELEGAEALCRLQDEEGNIIYPDEFIPLATKNGMMDSLGHEMFEKACAFMSQENIRFSSLKWINVNVAPEQFENPSLLSDFQMILTKYHLRPDQIHLEVTEESMIDRKLLHTCMAEFRQAGFVFSMDDFGSSYSNMIRLQQNHFSSVKIDRDFTWSYFDHPTALLPDIIHTCHDLGMKVVVEGVETKEMAEGIHAVHGDYIQGYYYSKPVDTETFIRKYIDENHSI